MRAHGLRVVIVAGMAALVLVAGGTVVRAGERPGPQISVELDNYDPTPLDEIAMTIHLTLPDGCFQVDEGQPAQGGDNDISVKIDAAEISGPCPGPTDSTLHRIVGPLPAGNYSIGAEINVDYLCHGLTCESVGMGIASYVRVASVGDANCDGSINSIDANVVLQESAALSSALCPQGADANRDGDIQSTDATLILQYDAGLLAQLPPG